MDHLFRGLYKSKNRIVKANKVKNVVTQIIVVAVHKDHVVLEIQVAKNQRLKRRSLSNSTI